MIRSTAAALSAERRGLLSSTAAQARSSAERTAGWSTSRAPGRVWGMDSRSRARDRPAWGAAVRVSTAICG